MFFVLFCFLSLLGIKGIAFHYLKQNNNKANQHPLGKPASASLSASLHTASRPSPSGFSTWQGTANLLTRTPYITLLPKTSCSFFHLVLSENWQPLKHNMQFSRHGGSFPGQCWRHSQAACDRPRGGSQHGVPDASQLCPLGPSGSELGPRTDANALMKAAKTTAVGVSGAVIKPCGQATQGTQGFRVQCPPRDYSVSAVSSKDSSEINDVLPEDNGKSHGLTALKADLEMGPFGRRTQLQFSFSPCDF